MSPESPVFHFVGSFEQQVASPPELRSPLRSGQLLTALGTFVLCLDAP